MAAFGHAFGVKVQRVQRVVVAASPQFFIMPPSAAPFHHFVVPLPPDERWEASLRGVVPLPPHKMG